MYKSIDTIFGGYLVVLSKKGISCKFSREPMNEMNVVRLILFQFNPWIRIGRSVPISKESTVLKACNGLEAEDLRTHCLIRIINQ